MKREDYLAGRVTHEEYYSALAKALGVDYRGAGNFLDRVRNALRSGDEHLNSIQLISWDIRASQVTERTWEVLREFDESPTLAVMVCVHKQAAKNAAREE